MKYYVYGGMKRGQNTKLHICTDLGFPLCGVKSNWMEAGEEIPASSFVHANFGIGDIRTFKITCKKCLKKYIL